MNKPDRNLFRGYWNLDEASGSAIDSTAFGHNLIEFSGTIPPSDGGRIIVANETEYFYMLSNSNLVITGDATFGIWGKLSQQGGNQCFFGKYDTDSKREWALVYFFATDRYQFYASDDGGTAQVAIANNYGDVPSTTWAFLLGWGVTNASTISISINAGTPDTVAHNGGFFNGSEPLRLGAMKIAGTVDWYLDSTVKSAFIYDGLMTADERTWMYNAGVSRKWNEIGLSGIKTINDVPMNNISMINGKSIQYINSINNAS